jgi:hypothetical protein
MFHKFNKHSFRKTMSNLKQHVHNGYHHVKHLAHNIDYGFSVAKDVYRVLEPVIREYAGNNHLHKHAMKAITGYENLRNQAMEANNHVTNIGSKLNGLI